MEKNAKRLFFALWPDEVIRRQIVALTGECNEPLIHWVNIANIHVTLVFLGNVSSDNEDQLKQQVQRIRAEPCALSFDKLDFWARPKVLCLTAKAPPQLHQLVDELKALVTACGLPVEDRPYRAHITLARNQRRPLRNEVTPLVWPVTSFSLVQSLSLPDGVRYRELQRWRCK